jgi:ribonuclease D
MKKIAPSKTDTALLELFPGLSIAQIFVPRTRAEFSAATQEILAAGQVGFDTESKPVFAAGVASDGPHIAQFALHDKAFIFQLSHSACREPLMRIFASEDVLKAGFGLKSDLGQIQAKFGIKLQAVLDLNQVFSRQGYSKFMGVRAAVGAVLHQRFHKSKHTTTSNWSVAQLTPKQLLYAANDAYAALKVFEALKLANGEWEAHDGNG